MNEIPPDHDSPPEPKALTSEKPSIRKSQEEFIGDMATPSMDKSEYQRQQHEREDPAQPASEGGETSRAEH